MKFADESVSQSVSLKSGEMKGNGNVRGKQKSDKMKFADEPVCLKSGEMKGNAIDVGGESRDW